MILYNLHLFNTGLCYAPISVSFCVNFACLISNFVSVIVLLLGFNFHSILDVPSIYKCDFPDDITIIFSSSWEILTCGGTYIVVYSMIRVGDSIATLDSGVVLVLEIEMTMLWTIHFGSWSCRQQFLFLHINIMKWNLGTKVDNM